MSGSAPWSIEQHVRADAERVFVPAELLPGAVLGDAVELTSPETATRCGRVVEHVTDEQRGAFVIVALDEPD